VIGSNRRRYYSIFVSGTILHLWERAGIDNMQEEQISRDFAMKVRSDQKNEDLVLLAISNSGKYL
jgi:hypothetical protein